MARLIANQSVFCTSAQLDIHNQKVLQMTAPPDLVAKVGTADHFYQTCKYCANHFGNLQHCPHCHRPSLYPNVTQATIALEVKALDECYETAVADARTRSCDARLKAFEVACANSQAFMGLPVRKLYRFLETSTDVFETYKTLEDLRNRAELPGTPNWQVERPQAEIKLLGADRDKEHLHYAALTLEDLPFNSYGECSMMFREDMIAHRTSCFQENSGVTWFRTKNFNAGMRSDWGNRHKLCVAKLAGKISASSLDSDFQSILLSEAPPGTDPKLDEVFVEVHIFGSITVKTLRAVAVRLTRLDALASAMWDELKTRLTSEDVEVSEK